MAVHARGVSVIFPTVVILIFLWSFLHLNLQTQPLPNPTPEPEAVPKQGSALDKEPLRIYVPPDEVDPEPLYAIPDLHHVASSPPATYPDVEAEQSGHPAEKPSLPSAEANCPIQPFDITLCPSVQRIHENTPNPECPILPFDISKCPPSTPPLEATPGSISAEGTPHDRPLISYAYSESDYGRINLAFFVNHGLHDAADFIFILNGETDVDRTVLPNGRHNVKIVRRENTCFDLGAHAEVLSREEDGLRALKDRYKRFILMNASIRGPFVPHWSKECWSEAYLGRLNERVKLVGSSLNCLGGESPHVQSMIWATDSTGLSIILQAEGIGECFPSLEAAMGGEIRTTPHLRSKGYEVDVMLSIFQTEHNYKYIDCKNPDDFLFQDAYFGFNVHPYETLFVKSHRGVEDNMLDKLSKWEDMSGYTSYDTCK